MSVSAFIFFISLVFITTKLETFVLSFVLLCIQLPLLVAQDSIPLRFQRIYNEKNHMTSATKDNSMLSSIISMSFIFVSVMAKMKFLSRFYRLTISHNDIII